MGNELCLNFNFFRNMVYGDMAKLLQIKYMGNVSMSKYMKTLHIKVCLCMAKYSTYAPGTQLGHRVFQGPRIPQDINFIMRFYD